MIISIDALDTLFFRDGKPFTMGDDNWAGGFFPPPPGVIYGSLRSAYFANNIGQLSLANTPDDPTANLEIKGVFVRLGKDSSFREAYFPLPQDCVCKKNNKKNQDRVYLLSLKELTGVHSSCPLDCALVGDDKVERAEGAYFSASTLSDYLRNNREFYLAKQIDDYLLLEPKTGIGRQSKTRTSVDGKLYRAGMYRMKDMDLMVDLSGLDLPESGIMKLGGEGKAAYYTKVNQNEDTLGQIELDGRRFKLYLATPAFFVGGWLPHWIDEETFIGNHQGIRVKLISAAIGKPLALGGFDLKSKSPKTMRRAVPAGSVYYFEILAGDTQEVLTHFHNKCISDYNPEQGYGLCFVGGVR
ncbi:MAG: type III-B CRISPR module-associated protein Cmr3 [Desulfotomaculaceae bacterium]|nr:type III-B CRISPR module-associated protein Cmr3 [Desulfotomaculaceae bacterium]